MFFPGSRYQNTGTYTITKPDGSVISAARLPLPAQPPLQGFHRRQQGERLDLIAARYLNDATTFWQLCNASDALSPDALAARDLVAIPSQAG